MRNLPTISLFGLAGVGIAVFLIGSSVLSFVYECQRSDVPFISKPSKLKVPASNEKINSSQLSVVPMNTISEISFVEENTIPLKIGIDSSDHKKKEQIVIKENHSLIKTSKINQDNIKTLKPIMIKRPQRQVKAGSITTYDKTMGPSGGLMWLVSAQEESGHWDTSAWEGFGSPDENLISTAHAILSFFGFGYTDRGGKWKKNIRKAYTWLLKNQKQNGSFSEDNYVNAVCSKALFEGIAMGVKIKGFKMHDHSKRAVEYISKIQNGSGGFSYYGTTSFTEPSYYDNMLATSWNTMALKSALFCGLNKTHKIKKSLSNIMSLLNNVEFTKDNSIKSKGYAWENANDLIDGGRGGSASQGQALLIRMYGGWRRDDPWCQAATKDLLISMPESFEEININCLYMSSLAIFEQKGVAWKKYKKHHDLLLKSHQEKYGYLKGSWSPVYDNSSYANRVLFTSVIISFQSLYHRFSSVMSN